MDSGQRHPQPAPSAHGGESAPGRGTGAPPAPTASDTRTYYVCPHNPNNPRHAAKNPRHVRAAFRDHVIYDAVDGILGALLSHDMAAVMAARIPATQADADERAAAKAGQLQRRIDQAEAFMKGLVAQLGHLGDRQDGAARAQRDRIDEQFTAATTSTPPPQLNWKPSPPASLPPTTPP